MNMIMMVRHYTMCFIYLIPNDQSSQGFFSMGSFSLHFPHDKTEAQRS